MNNTQILTLSAAFIATVASALVIFCERAFPFVLFSKKEPPSIIRFIEKYIPPMVMAALLFYCLKDVNIDAAVNFVPQLCALLLTVVLHLWKGNALISIFGGTGLYMIMIHLDSVMNFFAKLFQ